MCTPGAPTSSAGAKAIGSIRLFRALAGAVAGCGEQRHDYLADWRRQAVLAGRTQDHAVRMSHSSGLRASRSPSIEVATSGGALRSRMRIWVITSSSRFAPSARATARPPNDVVRGHGLAEARQRVDRITRSTTVNVKPRSPS